LNYRLPLALCLALLFIWSVPGTIALRSLLLLSAAVVLLFTLSSREGRLAMRSSAAPLSIFAALSLWFLLQPLIVATDPARVFGELKGQWLPATIALMVGCGLGTALLQNAQRAVIQAMTGIALVFGTQAMIAIGQSLWHWWQHGELLRQLVPLTGGKLEMSFVLNLLLAILTIDLFCRATARPPVTLMRLAGVFLLLLVALGSAYLAGARNGIIAIAFLSFSAISLFVFDQRRRLGVLRTAAAGVLVASALAGLSYVSYRADPRWQDFRETVALARMVEPGKFPDPGSPQWPKLADGRAAEASAFTRVASIRMGVQLIADAPLGHGYGRNAFGHALREDYGSGRGHAHSGWIDLGVGGGVPALLLWATLLGSLMWRGWRAFFDRGNAHGLLLFLLTTGYAGRMLLDSVNKDHMLQMFMFLAGLLLILTVPRRAEAGP
jgi:hypothetical protein